MAPGILETNGWQALVNRASIQSNGGPGILGRLHATLDVEGSTFTSNAGAIVCDQSTALETDLPHSQRTAQCVAALLCRGLCHNCIVPVGISPYPSLSFNMQRE
jgi:hypothetical protein